jgi:hypothetical protein
VERGGELVEGMVRRTVERRVALECLAQCTGERGLAARSIAHHRLQVGAEENVPGFTSWFVAAIFGTAAPGATRDRSRTVREALTSDVGSVERR